MDLSKKFWNENDDVTVNIEVKKDMASALKETAEDALPNMYLADHVQDDEKGKLETLDEVYDSIDADDYYYLDKDTYDSQFPDHNELPTGLDTVMRYSIKMRDEDKGSLVETADGYDEEQSTIKQNDLIEKFKIPIASGEKYDVLAYDSSSVMSGAILEDEKWTDFIKNGKDSPDCEKLSEILKINKEAKKDEYKLAVPEGIDAVHYGSNVVAGAAFRRYLKDIPKGENSAEDFSTSIGISDEDKMVVEYSERYAIRSVSDEDQVNACKRFLYVMMGAIGQKKKTTKGLEMTFPIRKEQVDEFAKTHANMKDFSELIKNSSIKKIFIGTESGDLLKYYKGIEDKDIIEKDKLSEYRDGYAKE